MDTTTRGTAGTDPDPARTDPARTDPARSSPSTSAHPDPARSASAPDDVPPVGPLRRTLAAFAVLTTLPYLALKVAWLSGSQVGLTDPEFGRSAGMMALNVATAGLDVVALALALVLLTRRGIRVPAGLVLPPLWIGAGLLGLVLVSLPVLLALGAIAEPAPPAELPPIEDWVFTMVYAGFAGLGVGLLGAFAIYARQRWGDRVVPAPTPGSRTWLAVAAVLVGVASVVHLVGTDAAPAQRIIDLVVGAVAAGALWSLRGTRARRTAVVLAFAGTGVLAAWGTYLGVVTVVPNDLVVHDGTSWRTAATSALRALAGIVGALALVVRLRERRTPAARHADG